MQAIRARFLSRFWLALALTLCQLFFIGQIAASDKHKLYDGPDRPPSELATIVVKGDSFVRNVDIQVNGKWERIHSGAQVLPGTYEINVLSMCSGVPPNSPRSRLLLPISPFFVYEGLFTAAAGDTVTYWFAAGDFPVFARAGKKGPIPYPLGTTCYGAWGAFYTITRDGHPQSDLVHTTGKVKSPAAAVVMKYLEAEGRGDEAAARALLSAKCEGDLSGLFDKYRKQSVTFSASNSQIVHDAVPSPEALAVDAKVGESVGAESSSTNSQAIKDAGVKMPGHGSQFDIDDGLVAQLVFLGGSQYALNHVIFHLDMEDGDWKITRIADWTDPTTPLK